MSLTTQASSFPTSAVSVITTILYPSRPSPPPAPPSRPSPSPAAPPTSSSPAIPAVPSTLVVLPSTACSASSISSSSSSKPSGQRVKRRMVECSQNDHLKELLKLVEPYLDVEAMLMLRATCRLFYRHKYKPSRGTLCFASFRGVCPKTVIETVLPIASRAVSASVREKLTLDFTANTLFKDASVARLMDAVHGDKSTNCILGNLCFLDLSFCFQVTDMGLAALLTTSLPSLTELRMRCARNKQLTGTPILAELSHERWPGLVNFDCSFTNVWLEPVEVAAVFILKNANRINTANSACRGGETQDEGGGNLVVPTINILGSWASRCLFDKLGFASVARKFCEAVTKEDVDVVAKLSKLMQKEFEEIPKNMKDYPLTQLLRHSGSQLLVNDPITITTTVGLPPTSSSPFLPGSKEGQSNSPSGTVNKENNGSVVDVWTLPITTAIQKQDHKTFNMLLKRGACVDVWDYLGKSPVCHACEIQRGDFLQVLMSQGATGIPYDLNGQSALDISIKKKNVDIIKILLHHGVSLNYHTSGLRDYKSPLYVACEVNSDSTEVASSEIVQLFLESAADPNWKSHTKYTPTMLAYQLNSAWLPHFLEAGAGQKNRDRWVLTEVLGCAIMKNDLESVKNLCTRYHDLLNREHPMWSKPHIQAAKLGKFEILQFLVSMGADVNARGANGQTALHDATEEGYIECVELLLDRNADWNICDADGHNPLHIACLENRYDVAELLLSRSHGLCGVNCRNKLFGETALMICARTRNAAMGDLVIKLAKEIDGNITDNQGRPALTYAIFFGQYSLADFLIDQGVDVTITDDAGNSPYTVVCERLLTQGSDKKTLKKYLRRLRVHKSKTRSKTRSAVSGLTLNMPTRYKVVAPADPPTPHSPPRGSRPEESVLSGSHAAEIDARTRATRPA